MVIELFYIGEDFYAKSKTMMSSIYTDEPEPRRYDLGFVSVALRRGDEVHIRQATEGEMEWAQSKLSRYTK